MTAEQKPANEPPDFWFRLRIELSPLQRLNSAEAEMTFRLEGEDKDVSVGAVPRGKLCQAKTIDFDVHGFDSKEEAHRVGLRLRKAVAIAAAVERIGVDTGTDLSAADESEDEQRARGYPVKSTMHGLTVHEGKLTGVSVANACLALLPDPKDFIQEIMSQFCSDPVLSEKQLLALELYGLSQFETSARARFLVLTSVIEVLAERDARPIESIEMISQLLDQLNSSPLEDDQKQSLRAGIELLQTEAIGKSCRRLVDRYLGKEAAVKFQDIYGLRSRLLHAGDCKDGDVGGAEFHLTHMAAAIFKSMFQGRQNTDTM